MSQHKPMPPLPLSKLTKVLFSALLMVCCAFWTAPTAADNRQVFTGRTYPWLNAVGKLEVPGVRYQDGRRSHYIEDCSATLVGHANGRAADTIITAWHCLEFYSDLSKPISFTLMPGTDTAIRREAYRLASGGSMDADWAILRLHHGVTGRQATALSVNTGRADPARPIIMAGYSKDEGVGAGGRHLSFDGTCRIIRQEKSISDTNCTAHKGASGGSAIQVASDGTPLVYGVISQGDGAGRSTFVPVQGFSSAISLHLK